MRFPLPILGLSAQLPLQTSPDYTGSVMALNDADFAFKDGPDIFSPKDLIELGRPGSGVANIAGDLVLVSFSKYSLHEKQNKKSIHIVPTESSLQPLEIALAKGGEAFWLDSRVVGHVVEGENGMELYAIDIDFETQSNNQTSLLNATNPPNLIGTFPTKTASNFRFSPKAGYLIFSDYVWPDGNLTSVKEQDEKWKSRGNTAYVYDTTYVRHWDTWLGKKRPALFSVRLARDPDRRWIFGNEFASPLRGTGHQCPVEPFGGTDDFDVSETHIVYTTKDPKLPDAWHTKQNVYIIDLLGKEKPKELTSGKQAAIHNPVFNDQGSKVAWLELDQDGYESDRAKIVLYDLQKDVRYTLTQKWDRSPDSLAFSKEGTFIYFTAGDEAKIKLFVLPIPPTPNESTTDPDLSPKYITPVALTNHYAASAIQPLDGGRLLFTQSSFTSPNDIYIIRNLQHYETTVLQGNDPIPFSGEIQRITKFTEDALKDKKLSQGEEFWFQGANNRDVHGWVLKPKGWKDGDRKKWPVVLLIHGGPQGAWEDQWSTRWNPNMFTQQGYFVVMMNPTGSTTFGQEFTDAIAEDWGGKPFVDMQKGWDYILHHYPEVDPARAVAAGASWGGYAINWIQGHPEYGFNFKALVCHDGVFDSNYNGYSTDELFFFNHEWGGRPWEKKSRSLSQKYSPSNFVDKWSTPQLLIHGSKDYRLPETESISAFNALQQLGIPSRLVVFPDENHWVLDHGNSIKWHYEVFRWFNLNMSSAFVTTFTRPLTASRPPSPALPSGPETPESTHTVQRRERLRALLLTLNESPSRAELQDCIDTLFQFEDAKDDSPSVYAHVTEEEALRDAISCKLIVKLYAHALDTYLNQAMQVEAEADWWTDIERSRPKVLMYLLQTLPSRISNLIQTIIQALQAQQLPVRISAFSPASLRRLFPSTKLFQPSALTTALFPHLQYQPLSITASTLLYTNVTVRKPSALANTITTIISKCMRFFASLMALPMELSRQECRYKRKELEKIRDERAETLGRLALLRGKLVNDMNTRPHDLQSMADLLQQTISGDTTTRDKIQGLTPMSSALPSIARLSSTLFSCRTAHEEQLTTYDLIRPSAIVLLWPKLFLLPPLCIYALRYAYTSRMTITQVAQDARETVVGFMRGWLIEPLKDVFRTVRAGGEDGVIVRRETVAADLNSLERMALSLAKDELHYGTEQLQDFSQKIRVGDLTPILELYEEDIKHPMKSALLGTLLRSVFIQVQKAKVDIDQTLTGIDRLLKSQELTFAFVGVAPALSIVYLMGGSIISLYFGGRGRGKYGGRAKRAVVWVIVRRIERLLITQPSKKTPVSGDDLYHRDSEVHSTAIAPLTSGLLLLAVARLRTFAEVYLPEGSRLQEGFLEDVADLEDPELGRRDKISIINRMWRSWSPALG
ncbi:hypothetical protein AX17_006241 [Amanita inopinata Kibby_2008]|nr:hypothetical protein AX17_006241 [Amanita inopinata Kibby_2008]